MCGMIFRKIPPIKFEIQLKWHTALQAPLFFSNHNQTCTIYCSFVGTSTTNFQENHWKRHWDTVEEAHCRSSERQFVTDRKKMAPFVLYSLRGQCMNFKHPSNGLQVPVFMTDRNQIEPFITHARRGWSLSWKKISLLDLELRTIRKISSLNVWHVEIIIATFVVHSWRVQVLNFRENPLQP
jgi:hypothetical protein